MADASPPIRVVCSDMSDNCLGRAEVLAKVLVEFGPVTIVGIQRGPSIWRPALSSRIPMRTLPVKSTLNYFGAVRWFRKELSGSRVVVSKPRPTSLGLVLAAGIAASQLLLDIDDWELGFMEPPATAGWRQRAGFYLTASGDLLAPRVLNSYWGVRALDGASTRVPRRFVSNTWLQQRFGGVMLPHVRDTDWLNPASFTDAAKARRTEHDLASRPWIGFVGTIREHKGVEDLIAAVAQLSGDRAPGLLLAGVDFERAFTKTILAEAERLLPPERLRIIGMFDASELPVWIAATDVVCVPSRDIPGAWGQIPAKLFDAMAMARPVVASDVNDMAQILSGCGLVYPPGNVAALRDCLRQLTEDHELAARLGREARSRAVAQFSVASGRANVADLVRSLPVIDG